MENYEKAEQDYMAGMKYKDIADKYDTTINTVKSWKKRYGWNRKEGAPQKEKVCTQNKKSAPAPRVEIDDGTKETLQNGDLTPEQQMFCIYYSRTFNATQSYLNSFHCSYDTANAEGYKLLVKPCIRNEIERLKEIKRNQIVAGSDDIVELQRKLRKQTADYRQFSAAAGVKVKNNRLRVVNGSSNLIKTSAYKKCSTSIRYNNPNGYYASIPKNWKIIDSDNSALKNTNPKFRTESGYDLNCPNCACAYEMRKRGYDVIARTYVSGGSHYLNMHPESAWEEAVIIECSGKNDIIKLLTETENDARFEVAYMRNHGGGHVIIAEKENGYIHFLDVQSGNEIDGSCLDKKNINSIKCFRIDNLEVSQHGVTACEKGD